VSKSLKEIILDCKNQLQNVSDTASLDASIIVEFVTGITKVKQIIDADVKLPEQQVEKIYELVNRRKTNEPIAYITNSKGFWKYDFYVDNRVLIPRPETELIVDHGIKHLLKKLLSDKKSVSILDLGCGSGCIGLSILKDLLEAKSENDLFIDLSLVDKSQFALEVAKINFEQLHLDNSQKNYCVKFINSDWFSSVRGKFDLIVCNPPYIAKDDSRVYSGSIFEPRSALYSDDFGHADIKIILSNIRNYLDANSLALIELGIDSAQKFRGQVDQIITDSSGIDRVLVVQS
jgi:release factor glutamine methyltransferase